MSSCINLYEQRRTAGLSTDVSQTFYANIFIDYDYDESTVYIYDLPTIEPSFGTLRYTSQDNRSIFANFSSPCINYRMTGTTDEITGITITNRIFKLEYDVWTNYVECWEYENSSNLERETDTSQRSRTSERTIETTDSNGQVTTQIIRETLYEQESEGTFDTSNCPTFNEIKRKLTRPIYTEVIAGTSILYDNYSFEPPEFVVNENNETVRLFEDGGQYFIAQSISSTQDTTTRGGGYLPGFPSEITITVNPSAYTINTGPASGITVSGHFMTYFIIPSVPVLEDPIMSGDLTTFTPTFSWSNTEDGHYQIIQMTYFSADTGFTGTVFTYDAKEYTELNNIRSYSVPLVPDRTIRYRIGNVKELNPNVFGVKQEVVSFTDSYVFRTQSTDIAQRTATRTDSRSSTGTSTLEHTISSNDLCTVGAYSLSGYVYGSVVTGATMQLVYPTGNYVTLPTTTDGYYEFDELQAGSYTLNTYYRGYLDDSKSISLTGNTSLDISMKLLWSNAWDTWGKFAGETYNY